MYEPVPLTEPVVLTSGYTPPDVADPVTLCEPDLPSEVQVEAVVLRENYTPPDLSIPVYLCVDVSWLKAEIPAPSPVELTASARAYQAFEGALATPMPVLALPTLAPQIEAVLASSAEVALPTPADPVLSATAELKQDLDLPDNGAKRLSSQHSTRLPKTNTPLKIPSHDGAPIRLPLALAQQHGLARNKPLPAPAAEMIRYRSFVEQQHQHGAPLNASTNAPHAEAIRTRSSARTRHAHGVKRLGYTSAPHAETDKRRQSLRMAERQGLPAGLGLSIGNKNAWATGTRLEVRWAQAAHPEPGYWWQEKYTPPSLDVTLECQAGYVPRPLHCDVVLGFAYPPQPPCPTEPDDETVIIPTREEYRVINTLTITELDNTPVPAEDFSASIDADSWTWSWNARIPADAMMQVRPDSSTRVELVVTINGEPLRVLVENIQRERKFGENWLRVSGRGRAAFLADPLAPVTQHTNDGDTTAQQALNDTLTTNGVPIGWTLDWQIEDWQIPAGIWSHSGTWIDAAKRIAEAGGAYVQSHDTDQTLRILPKYPVAPWAWNSVSPDIQLPEDAIEVEGIEWQEKADYNAVWVHGGEQGRADRIIRGSTGGTNPAPTIVDELATDQAMTRQRGLALLGDTGKQAQISLRLPVLPETGMIRPGTLIEYMEQGNTRRGLVRSLSVSHSWPELWQTIGVETHE